MANALIELEQANKQIEALKLEVNTSLQIAEGFEADAKKLKEDNEALSKKLEEVQTKVIALESKNVALENSQKDFEAKVEAKASARALEIAASVGVPPVLMTATVSKTPEEIERERISSLKGLARSEAAIALQLKRKK